MSRSGYSEGLEIWDLIRWRGAVKSALRGRRGQAFLRELLAALDALPDKKLIAGALERDGEYCALGAVGRLRGIEMPDHQDYDPEDYDNEWLARNFGIAEAMVREIEYINDEEGSYWRDEEPQKRFSRVRDWVVAHIAQQEGEK